MDGGVQLLPRAAVEVLVSAGSGQRSARVQTPSVLPVINTQSRGMPPEEASARFRALCRDVSAAGRTVWFKKIDSTLRGNVGAELAALHEALAPCVIVCTPALPEQGRTVRGGALLVAGEPVMATPTATRFPPRTALPPARR